MLITDISIFFEVINFAFLFVRFFVGYLWAECRVTLKQFKDRFYLVVFEEVRFNLSENIGKKLQHPDFFQRVMGESFLY